MYIGVKSIAAVIWNYFFGILPDNAEKQKSWIFLQDFIREKQKMDKNFCPFFWGRPLSLFWKIYMILSYFVKIAEYYTVLT